MEVGDARIHSLNEFIVSSNIKKRAVYHNNNKTIYMDQSTNRAAHVYRQTAKKKGNRTYY